MRNLLSYLKYLSAFLKKIPNKLFSHGKSNTIIGVIIGACISILTTQMHLSSEKTRLQIQSIISNQKMFQDKAERLFGEISDLISFFDTNNLYEIKEAKMRIAKARRTAFEFAVYTSPEMSLQTLDAIEAINTAAEGGKPEQVKKDLERMQNSIRGMILLFYKEREIYERNHSALLK